MYTIFSYTSYANDLWLSPAADTGMWVVRLVVCCEDGKAATCWSQGTPPSVGPQDQVNSWHPHLGGASQPLPHSFWLVSLRYHIVPLVDCNRKHNQCHAVLFMLLMMNAFIYAILHSWADSLRSHVILHEWLAFYTAFLNIYSAGMAGATWNCCCLCILCIPYNHAQPHLYGVCMFTCNLHFWQNDRGLLHATVITWGWNRYRNKSQHKKLTLEKIFTLLLQGLNQQTFDHESGTLATELSPLSREL